MKLDGQGAARTFVGGAAAVFLLAAVSSCNDHRLIGFKQLVKVGVEDCVEVADKPKIDMLWVVDNSGSMCQEQANLARNFRSLADSFRTLDADINLAVVTTDLRDESQQGRFQNKPATENNASCEQPCDRDEHCGGGCLCGVPHVRQCAADADCVAPERCVAAPGGALRHCAAPCANIGPAHVPTSDKCGFDIRKAQVLTCQASAEAGGAFCMLAPCGGDADCNGADGQKCLAAADGRSYCRRFRAPRQPQQCTPGVAGQCPLGGACEPQPDGTGKCQAVGECPPPTCDCPKNLPKVLNSGETANLERDFRCMATVGTQGDTFEKGLEAMRKALEPSMTADGGPNEGFLRDDAYLSVAILSDEADCSDAVQTCNGPDDPCKVCLSDGRCRGLGEDDAMKCEADPVDQVSYCRLPRREGNECEHYRDWLRPVDDYVEFLRRRKDDPDTFTVGESRTGCRADEDCLQGEFCSRKAGKCLANRIVVAAIVGPKEQVCVTACPSDNPVLDCVQDPTCRKACDVELGEPNAICADRVYNPGSPQPTPMPTCSSLNGQAFNGRRYSDLVAAFKTDGTQESICAEDSPTGEFTTALSNIADIIKSRVQRPFCLSRPLHPCGSDADCKDGGKCITPADFVEEGQDQAPEFVPYCGNPASGIPEGIRLTIYGKPPPEDDEAAAASRDTCGGEVRQSPTPSYTFHPGSGPGGYGCYQFIKNGPAAGETAVFRYRAGLVLQD